MSNNDILSELESEIKEAKDIPQKIALIQAASPKLIRYNAPEAIRLIREAIRMAEQINDPGSMARLYCFSGVCCFHQAKYEEALAEYEAGCRCCEQSRNNYMYAQIMHNKVNILIHRGEFTGAASIIAENLDYFAKLDDKLWLARSFDSMAGLRSRLGDFSGAIELFFRSARLQEELGARLEMGVAYHNIGVTFARMEEFGKAAEYYERALEIRSAIGDRYGKAMTLQCLSVAYTERALLSQALPFEKQAIVIFREIGQNYGLAKSLVNLAMIYERKNRPKAALRAYRSALRIVRKLNNKELLAYIYFGLSTAEGSRGRMLPAMRWLERTIATAEQNMDRSLLVKAYRKIAELHEDMKDMITATHYYKLYISRKEELMNEEKQRAIIEMQTKFDVERIGKEREIERLRADRLELELEKKNRELTLLALQMAHKNKLLTEVSEDLGSLQQLDKAHLKKLSRKIKVKITPKQDWETFSMQFVQVHPQFIQALQQKVPNLSPTELKICCFLKLNLTTKDIANLLNIEARTVQIHRGNIRKKIHLPQYSSLESCIAKL